MGCTCQTPTCVAPHLPLWLLIIMSKISTWTFKQRHAAEMRIQLAARVRPQGVLPVNCNAFMQTERILKCAFILFIPVWCRCTKHWLFFHSTWHLAVIQSPELIAWWIKETCAAPNNGNPGEGCFFSLPLLPLFQSGADWMNRSKCSTSLYLDARCSFQFEAVY